MPEIGRIEKAKAVLKTPHSRRFARFVDAQQTRQRLECGAFTAAFPNPFNATLITSDPKSNLGGIAPRSHRPQPQLLTAIFDALLNLIALIFLFGLVVR